MSRIKVGLHQKFRVIKVGGRLLRDGDVLTVDIISPDFEFYGFAEELLTACFINEIFGIYAHNEILYLLEPVE